MCDQLIQYYSQSGDSTALSSIQELWLKDEETRLSDLISFIDEFINSEEYEDYLEKKRKIIKKDKCTQYSKNDFLDVPVEKITQTIEYPLTQNAKKMFAFIKRFETYTRNQKNMEIMNKQMKGIAVIRSKIEEVKRITVCSMRDSNRRDRVLDEELKEFCETYNIDFGKIRQQNKRKIREKVVSFSRVVRIRHLNRKENIAAIAKTILEEMKRDKKIAARLNKSYDYKVVKNEWTVMDMEIVGTAISLQHKCCEETVAEQVQTKEVIKTEDIIQSKPETKGKKAKKDAAKAKKTKEKKAKKPGNNKNKLSKSEEQLTIPLGQIKNLREKITGVTEDNFNELVEDFKTFDEIMENQRMITPSPKPTYAQDKNFLCQPEILLFSNYKNGKTYKKIFKIQNNNYEPRKFRFLKLTTANEYDSLLFELKPLIGITKLYGGASISMILIFKPTFQTDEINVKLTFISFDYKTQRCQNFFVCAKCTLSQPDLKISSNNITFGKIPPWQRNKCFKMIKLSNDGVEPCKVVIKQINLPSPFEETIEDILTIPWTGSLRFSDVEDIYVVIKTITRDLVESVFANFRFDDTFIKLKPSESKIVKIHMKNVDHAGNYIEKYSIESFDNNNQPFITYEVIVEADVTDHFLITTPSILDFGTCLINSVYQTKIDIKNTSSSTQAITIKVPTSIKDYIKPDVTHIYLSSNSLRTVWIRLFVGNNITESVYFNKELTLLEFPLHICVLTKNYNEVPPVVITVFAILTYSNLLNITALDNRTCSYYLNALEVDLGPCSIYESISTDLIIENNGLLSEIYGFIDLPPYITVEPNYGFGEILPGAVKKLKFLIHPDYKDILNHFTKMKFKDYVIKFTTNIETITNLKTLNRFFDPRRLRESVELVLQELINPLNIDLQTDINNCIDTIRQELFTTTTEIEEEYTIQQELFHFPTLESKEFDDHTDKITKLNITSQLTIKFAAVKPLVEVSYQYIQLPDTPCSSYSVGYFEIKTLKVEFSEETDMLKKKDLKLPNYEAWFKITGDNPQIRIEPSCGILKKGEKIKICLISTPSVPQEIIKETARTIKYSEIYELKKREFEMAKIYKESKSKTKRVKDKKVKGDTGKKTKEKRKKGKSVKNKKSTQKTQKTESEIYVLDSEVVVNYEDLYPAEMFYWRNMEPYIINSTLNCFITYSSDYMIRPKEVLTINVNCKVVRPDFISNLKFQRIDFGAVVIGTENTKEIILQNIKYNKTIELETSLLNPIGPFNIPFVESYKIPPECYLKLPIKFIPSSANLVEEYFEITSGSTVLPMVLQGIGVEIKIHFFPEFLVCRLNKAKVTTIEECVFKIQNLSKASVTLHFEKLFEIEGTIQSVTEPKVDEEDKLNKKGRGEKDSVKSKSHKQKQKIEKTFSNELTPSEIYSLPKFNPTRGTSHFDILNIDNNRLTLDQDATEVIRIGFGMKGVLEETKRQLHAKTQKQKKKKENKDKQTNKNVTDEAERIYYVTKYNITAGQNFVKDIILFCNFK